VPLLDHPVPWPGGARSAAAFTFDVDVDSMIELTYGAEGRQRVAGLSWLSYDEVAVPRILRLYRELGLRQTFFFPGWCIEQYPHLVEACAADGHEIGVHGYLHEISREQDPGEEERLLDRTMVAALRVLGGERPVGWRAPLYGLSAHSARLLAERGFLYDASLMGDDVPYLLRTTAGDLVELPSEWANDDWTHYASAPDLDYSVQVRAPAQAARVYRAEIDAARRHGALWVSVWHPNVSGRLARFELVAELVAEAVARDDVWVAPLREIAEHITTCIADASFAPRVVIPEAPRPSSVSTSTEGAPA
jgi:peptidoglycan/xylan/chitin deacetylase (PgdA/CDA1 family)